MPPLPRILFALQRLNANALHSALQQKLFQQDMVETSFGPPAELLARTMQQYSSAEHHHGIDRIFIRMGASTSSLKRDLATMRNLFPRTNVTPIIDMTSQQQQQITIQESLLPNETYCINLIDDNNNTQFHQPLPQCEAIHAPFNPIEQHTTAISLCKLNLPRPRFVATRPLTGFERNGTSWRFTDAPFPLDYGIVRDALLQHVAPAPPSPSSDTLTEAQAWMKNLVESVDHQLNSFSSILHFETELSTKILPMINSTFEELDETTVQLLTDYFQVVGDAVRESSGVRARERCVATILPSLSPSTPLAKAVLDWVANQIPSHDWIRVGVSLPRHGKDIQQWFPK